MSWEERAMGRRSRIPEYALILLLAWGGQWLWSAVGDPVLVPGTTELHTVGTITGGTWEGTAIANAYVAGLDQDCLMSSSPTFVDLTLTVPSNIYALSHDSFAGFVLHEHALLAASIAGTANQVAVTDDGDGTVTLSTPQDIDTGADVQFGKVGAGIAPTNLLDVYASGAATVQVKSDTGTGTLKIYGEGTGSAAVLRWLDHNGAGDEKGWLMTMRAIHHATAAEDLIINHYDAAGPTYTTWLQYDVSALNLKCSQMFEVQTSSSVGHQSLTIDQDDADKAFIDYQGTSAANANNNISTWTTGNTIQGFIRVEINGTERWIAYWDAPTAP